MQDTTGFDRNMHVCHVCACLGRVFVGGLRGRLAESQGGQASRERERDTEHNSAQQPKREREREGACCERQRLGRRVEVWVPCAKASARPSRETGLLARWSEAKTPCLFSTLCHGSLERGGAPAAAAAPPPKALRTREFAFKGAQSQSPKPLRGACPGETRCTPRAAPGSTEHGSHNGVGARLSQSCNRRGFLKLISRQHERCDNADNATGWGGHQSVLTRSVTFQASSGSCRENRVRVF